MNFFFLRFFSFKRVAKREIERSSVCNRHCLPVRSQAPGASPGHPCSWATFCCSAKPLAGLGLEVE